MFKQLLLVYLLGLTLTLGCNVHQVHIALSDFYHTLNPADPIVKIAFHTNNKLCLENHVLLHMDDGSKRQIPATSTHFKASYDSGDYETYVHYASVTNIKFDTQYKYEIFVSNKGTYEGPFTFRAPNPNPTPHQRNFIIYGDFDSSTEGQQTLSYLKSVAKDTSRPIDLFFHIGDLAYNLEKKAGKRGDEFMKDIQDIAANVPYMVTMGNHEAYNNFSNFNMRFQMPFYQYTQNNLYSINVDNVHFVSIDLELPVLQPQYLANVVNWLEQDLKEANANRAERPWIIVYGHRPIYCSEGTEGGDCAINPTRFQAVEEVMYKYGVDMYFAGHIHSYERNLPVYKGKVMPFTKKNSDKGNHYIQDPQAPLHILAGIPGHRGYPSGKRPYPVKKFCTRIDRDYSVGIISVQNNTHLLWQNIHTKDGQVDDYMYLIKTKNSYAVKSAHHFLEEAQEDVAIALNEKESTERYELSWIYFILLAVVLLVYLSKSRKIRPLKLLRADDSELAASIVN